MAAAAAVGVVAWLRRGRILGDAPGEPRFPATRAPAAPARSTASPDDLTEVKGIGPAYRDRLAAAGVTSFTDLVEAGPAAVAEAAGVGETVAAGWIEQALALPGAR